MDETDMMYIDRPIWQMTVDRCKHLVQPLTIRISTPKSAKLSHTI